MALTTAPLVGKSAEPVHYKLCGVLYHHDDSEPAGSRHYTVDVLHSNLNGGSNCEDSGEAWLHIDDNAVSVMQHEVFGHFGGQEAQDNDRSGDQCAYMLLYSRTTSRTTC